MRKFFVIISLVLTVLTFPLWGQKGFSFEEGGYKYLITSVQGGEVTVVGISEDTTHGPEVVFPESLSYNGREFQITALGDSLFKGTEITGISFPKSLKRIGEYAFYGCTQLGKIAFPTRLEEVGSWAFGNCGQIKSVELNAFISVLNNGIFYGCSGLESVKANVPTTINSIGDRAFENCNALKDFNTGGYTEKIGKSAFRNCTELQNPDFGWNALNKVVTIGDSAFYNASSLSSLPNVDKVYTMYIQPSAFENAGLKGTLSLSLHNNGNDDEWYGTIGKRAFANTLIDSLYIRDALPLDSAFADCKNLQAIEFTEMADMGPDLFAGCTSLKQAKISYHRAYKGCMRNIPGLESVELKFFKRSPWYGYTSSSWETVCEEMFAGCSNLKSVSMAESFSIIDINAFKDCSSLTEVSMPNIKEINQRAFYNCRKLSNIGSHTQLSDIRAEAFLNSAIHTITFGEKLRYYGENAIEPLDTIFMDRKTPEVKGIINHYEFSEDNYLNTVVVVPPTTLQLFQTTSPWDMFWNIIEASDPSALETIPSDNSTCPVEYYDLNGIRINNESLVPGLYIKRQGNKTEKVVIGSDH